VEQVQSYLEQLERQKTETVVHQNVHCLDNKAAVSMRPSSTINYNNTSYYHSPPAYSSCGITPPVGKSHTEDLTVYHADQLGPCLAQTDANHPGGVIPMVGSSLKPEVGLSTADDGDCFTPSGQQCVGATYTPADVHRAGNADSSTCLYSR